MIKNNIPRGYWLLKANPLLKQKLDMVINERIKNGLNTSTDIRLGRLNYKRLTLAIARHDNLIKDLINADLIEDDKK